MDDNTAYCLMILSPMLFLVSKLSVHYIIVNDILRMKHSKTFILKNKGTFFESFFLLKFKNEISRLLYYLNVFLGILLLIGIVLSLLYFVLWIIGYQIRCFVVPYSIMCVDILLVVIRIIRLIYEKLAGSCYK